MPGQRLRWKPLGELGDPAVEPGGMIAALGADDIRVDMKKLMGQMVESELVKGGVCEWKKGLMFFSESFSNVLAVSQKRYGKFGPTSVAMAALSYWYRIGTRPDQATLLKMTEYVEAVVKGILRK